MLRNLACEPQLGSRPRWMGLLLASVQNSQLHCHFRSHEYGSVLLLAYLQALANISYGATEQDISLPAVFFENGYNNTINVPLTIFVINFFDSNDAISRLLKEEKHAIVAIWLVDRFEHLDTDQGLSAAGDQRLLHFAQRVVSHESYNNWLHKLYDTAAKDQFTRVMKYSQLIVTSKDDWDNFTAVSLLAWIHDFLQIFAALTHQELPQPQPNATTLRFVHANLIAVLDCLADLAKLNCARQFLEHYNVIDSLIDLLRVVHQNVARKTLKSKIEPVTAVEFPHVKSLIIEVISFVAHESFAMQERVRERHGLELVLSNCMIDDNDPFIKERAIVCIKVLLEANTANQLFVASLEAQQLVDDEVLREVGYEVQIDNGKVGLRKRQA